MEHRRMLKAVIAGILNLVCYKLFFASASTTESDVTALKSVLTAWQTSRLNWTGNDPCGLHWQGVKCDGATNTRITQLSLGEVGIQGRLLRSIGGLMNLVSLDLSFNQMLTGPLPTELGNLTKLQMLNLQSCGFTGSIPAEFGNLAQLEFLALNDNHLDGNIPSSLGKLRSVSWFDLSQNLLSGNIPVSTNNQQNLGLDNLTAAVHLHLSRNFLSGLLPKELCYMPNIIHLLLDGNNLSGPIPSDVTNFQAMEILRLDSNQFEGEIPTGINNVVSLKELHLSNNSMKGTIPDLSNLQQLELLRLSINLFDSQVFPNWILNLTTLQTIEMDEDNLTGMIPPQLFELSSLEVVSFRSNQLSGVVQLDNVAKSLASIFLQNNNISDVTGLTSASQYQLILGGNPICNDTRNKLLSSVCSAETILESWEPDQLHSCNISCKDDKLLTPACACAFPLILLFQFNAPSFTHITDDRMSNLHNLLQNYLYLTTDQVWIGSANFTDDDRLLANVLIFPSAIESWTQDMVSRILSRLGSNFTLNEFGPYQLNYILLPPLIGSGNKTLYGKSIIAGVILGVLGFIALLGILGIYFWHKRRYMKLKSSSKLSVSWGSVKGDAPQLKGACCFSYDELSTATNDFSPSNQIGDGGYGKVYKGVLPSGQVMAIKRAKSGSFQGGAEFKTELELLSRLHHKNLVALIGFCYEQGEQMLVYEYMPNGTLYDHLRGKGEGLSWQTRIEIAVGAAKGIAYLHEMADPPVIHRDIKSSNILLDKNFMAKVSDFGISKLALVGDGANANGPFSTQVKGTLGYLDPEYYCTERITQKSDVYSFGVVLMELITARPPIENGKSLVRDIMYAWEMNDVDTLQGFIDPTLQNYDHKDLEYILRLAFSLLKDSGAARPSMSEVLKFLETILARIV
ncbi:hypothetical protein O6H91_06G112600 [Diphasiastrum complanatum]|uniref:Uncharacterized protein n=1 Tax=Diphasiastrum complanatum TaxID=34168 RepID=A0ACC2DHK2_DIPCM|nr:hypothetical protein O6H91_06G112600 [Diphasiastrum complanatum]